MSVQPKARPVSACVFGVLRGGLPLNRVVSSHRNTQYFKNTSIIEDISKETAVDLMQQGRLNAAVLWQPLLGETAQSIKGNIIFSTQEVESLVIDMLVSL
jgi:ABC-type nitrate/sulfonate/bicarbonate transport system substrate-binding protein